MSQLVTLTIASQNDSDVAKGARATAEYRDAGRGSNRTIWDRVKATMIAVYCVLRSGKSTEVTAVFKSTGKSPAFNLVHRQLSAGLIRPEWDNVQVVALVGAVQHGNQVTGKSDTAIPFYTPVYDKSGKNVIRWKDNNVRVFISPVS